MRPLLKRILASLCVLALVSSSTVSFAAPTAGAPCAQERHDAGDATPHKHHGAACLSCCLGACVAVPDLPSRGIAIMLPLTPRMIVYWEPDLSLPGRSIAPDLGPPRSQI